MTEVSSSIRDSRKSSVFTIESKTNEDKVPLVKMVIEKDDLTGEEDEKESIVQEVYVSEGSGSTELEANDNGSDENASILERYIKSLQNKSSLQSLESFESFESNESSLKESENDSIGQGVQEEAKDASKPDFGDHVINALIIKRRTLMMDQDEEDVISYEESEIRIIKLFISLGFIFLIVSCPFIFLLLKSPPKGRTIDFKKPSLNFLEPKLTLLDTGTGKITTFAWKNQRVMKAWEKPLPWSRNYYPYFDNGYLNIIFGDGAKGMTYIDVNSPKNCHRILPSGKFFQSCGLNIIYCDKLLNWQTLKVGNFLLWFGGQTNLGGAEDYPIMLWNMKRHKWFQGIHLPNGAFGYTEDTWIYQSYGYDGQQMCGVGVNDSTALLFGLRIASNETCSPYTQIDCDFQWEGNMTKFTLDLKVGQWVDIDSQFHSFSDLDGEILGNVLFACDSTFSKELELDIVISISIEGYQAWDKLLYILVVNWKSSMKRIIELEKPSHLVRYDTTDLLNNVFVLNGVPYYLVPIIENNDESNVQLYLYEINLQRDSIKLVFKISNYTFSSEGLKVVPFIGSNTVNDHDHICDL